MTGVNKPDNAASSRGVHFNTGNGPSFQLLDIGHADYMAVLEPDTAFWSLVKKDKIGGAFTAGSSILQEYSAKRAAFADELNRLRFGLTPTAVYFNPTERCNLNCSYCYIPETMRKSGVQMSKAQLLDALDTLKKYFRATMPEG